MKMNFRGMVIVSGASIALGQPQQGDGIWLRDAFFGEAQTFDACVGHQPASGMYHHHANPICLRGQLGDNVEAVKTSRTGTTYREKAGPWKHSPILGWSFDGYPIYGPYGFSNPRDSGSEVRRMRPGFRLRSITERSTLPDWVLPLRNNGNRQLTTGQFGPAINSTFPLGRYLEDYEFVEGLGDLDVHNGRFTLTPEFPQGTYAYFVTIDDGGTPVFPYIIGGQYFGAVTGGVARNVPEGLQDYFTSGSLVGASTGLAVLDSWATRNSQRDAQVVSGFNPSAGPATTWPNDVIAGARTNGGTETPLKADIQRIRQNDSSVVVNANGVASYVMGPWFDALQPGGLFGGYPSNQNMQVQLPKSASAAAEKRATGLGPVGLWVNGVAVFNMLDGASYSNGRGADVGGGLVNPTAIHVSAASFERGPQARGSLVTAFALFGSELAAGTATADSANWPLSLGGVSVSLRDAGGASHSAPVYFVSRNQVNYRIPETAAPGLATVNINTGAAMVNGNILISAAYPHLFAVNAEGAAAAYVTRVSGGAQWVEPVNGPIDLGPASDQVYLVVYGSGRGAAASATATVGGERAEVIYAGPQGVFQGLDQFNILMPRALAGRGKADIVVTVDGKASNAVHVEVR
jgi:uncharacterized protein (TIGR03437 family)